jgi:ABC-2 type transport system ATP-binding protein
VRARACTDRQFRLPTVSGMPLLEARHLRKSYGAQLAVGDVSFELHAGEIFGLLGPNGAGKSTTMMMLAGLLPPDAGEVWLDGQPFVAKDPGQRRELGVVPQDLALYVDLSAWDNLRFFGRLYGLRGNELEIRCRTVLEDVGLVDSAHRAAGEYSGGMKRRLNFAIGLLHRPRVLILDEPTVGVDPQSRSHLLDCVRRVAAAGVGVIYASHYMEEVQSLCRRVAIIDHGRVLAYESIENLLAGLSADLHVVVSGVAQWDDWRSLADVQSSQNGHGALIIPGSRPDRTTALRDLLGRLATAGVTVERIETQQTNLERLFLQLTGHGLRD